MLLDIDSCSETVAVHQLALMSETAHPRVSVVLPTFNGEDDLRRMLPKLLEQDFDGGVEICAIDSSSADGTVALLKEVGARVEVIPQAEFSHGPTRNHCALSARGEFLVFMSQDVMPAHKSFLSELIGAFEDERVAGAYSRVLPHPDDDPLTARTVLDLPESSEQAFVRDLDSVQGLWELDPDERIRYLRFNNVASAIRTSVFGEFPFPPTAFAEDFAWASRVLSRGWRIAYVPTSVVQHAHAYTLRSAYERYRVDAAFHRQAHGWLVRPSAFSAMRGFLYEVREDIRYVRRHHCKTSTLLRSPGLRAAQVLGQYAGSHGWGDEDLLTAELLED